MSGASPGGAAQSSLKKRRLAALSQAYGAKAEAAPPAVTAGPTGKLSDANREQGSRAVTTTAAASRGKSKHAVQPEVPDDDAFPYNSLPLSVLEGPVGRSLSLRTQDAAVQEGKMTRSVEQLLQMLLGMGKQGALGRNTGEIVAERVVNKVVVLENLNTKPAIGSLKKQFVQQHSTQLLRGQERKQQLKHAAAAATYSVVAQVHEVWRQYATQQLGANPMGSEEKLLQMDLHGAFITVSRCRQRQLEGLEGLVFHVSNTTLHVVTPDNRRQYVPIAHTVFKINLGERYEAVVAGQNLLRAWNKQLPLAIKF